MGDGNVRFEISRTDYTKTRFLETPTSALGDGEVRFAVERFALTANTTTYALVGDMLGYWDFFPTDEGWGRVPAIGWGRIVESAHPDVSTGGLYFGWFPMSRTIDMTVSGLPDGVRDDGKHRAAHAPVYRTYTATEFDPFHEPGEDAENRHALLRGLFITGFLADDFFADSGYYGASRVIVMSASSKTAISFAQRAALRDVEVVGLTSTRNAGFVRSLGCYACVLEYDAIASLPADIDTVLIDMAGNATVLARVHDHLGARLRYSMTVGMSHAGAAPHAPPTKGPTPELFFAPGQIEKRIESWGIDGYRERVNGALREFVGASRDWLEVTRSSGPQAAENIWLDTLAGKVAPSVGHIVSV
jgi:hypothetical protein